MYCRHGYAAIISMFRVADLSQFVGLYITYVLSILSYIHVYTCTEEQRKGLMLSTYLHCGSSPTVPLAKPIMYC